VNGKFTKNRIWRFDENTRPETQANGWAEMAKTKRHSFEQGLDVTRSPTTRLRFGLVLLLGLRKKRAVRNPTARCKK